MIGHPDHTTSTGFMTYTTQTRAALKKLLPTCQQPTAADLARADAVAKMNQKLYDPNTGKPRAQASAPVTAQANASRVQAIPSNPALLHVRPPKNAEERALRRCVSSGRLPATCTGNSLLGAFGQMIAQALPLDTKGPQPGPELIGAYQGPGIGVLTSRRAVSCSTAPSSTPKPTATPLPSRIIEPCSPSKALPTPSSLP